MRLPIILLAVFVVCFEQFGWITARVTSKDNKKACKSPYISKTSIPSGNFFLATPQKLSTIQHSKNKLTITSNIEIENNSQSNFVNYNSIGKITNNCAKNTIYMLKHNVANETKKTLDVIHYDENNKFKRIEQVENMFDNAISIASDYKTGKIYWAVNDNGNYSIKVTDELFSEPNYIIYPNNEMSIDKIQVYPKRSEIFFFSGSVIWYTSYLSNSTPKLLVSGIEIQDFAIDYTTDNLCWVETAFGIIYIRFYCVNIDTPLHTINKPASKFSRVNRSFGNLGTFNNTLYWTEKADDVQVLYANDGYETTAKLARIINDPIQSFITLNCPSAVQLHIKEARQNKSKEFFRLTQKYFENNNDLIHS